MVGSASIAIAEGRDVGPFYYLARHIDLPAHRRRAGGVAAMRTELKTIEQHSQWLPLVVLVLLLLVFVPGIGVTVKGARRWLNLGMSTFQAVEAVKLMLHRVAGELPRAVPRRGQRDVAAMLKPLGVACLLVGILLVVQQGLRFVRADPRDHCRHAGAGRRQHAAHVRSGAGACCRCWRDDR